MKFFKRLFGINKKANKPRSRGKSDPKYTKIEVGEFKPNWVKYPTCKRQFCLEDRNQWTGMYHSHCGQRLKIKGHGKVKEFLWCLVGNITKRGTNRLKAGTKTYLYPPLWGDGYANIRVVGKDWETGKFIEITIDRRWMSNFRVQKITKVDLISRFLEHYDDSEECKHDLLETLQILEERERKEREITD